jgi:O-antigen/teichoic acid export membrane protein
MGLYLIVSQVLLNLHLWFLQSLWTGPMDTVGIYVAALNLARMFTFVSTVLSGVLFSSLSWALANNNENLVQHYIQSASRFACTLLFPLCTVFVLHVEPIMRLLYTDVYASGGLFLMLQLLAFGASAFFDLYLMALMAAGKYYQCTGLLLALLPIAILTSLIFIPTYGALGAAIALLGVIILGTVLAVVYAFRRFGALMSGLSLARITGATALIALLGMQVSVVGYGLLLELTGLIAIYVLLLGLFRELRWDDLKAFALWEKVTS